MRRITALNAGLISKKFGRIANNTNITFKSKVTMPLESTEMPLESTNTKKLDKDMPRIEKIELIYYKKIGFGWEENGIRKCFIYKLPKRIALKLFKIEHPELERFEDD